VLGKPRADDAHQAAGEIRHALAIDQAQTASVPTISHPRTRSKARLSGRRNLSVVACAPSLRSERHDDLAENLPAFERASPFSNPRAALRYRSPA
jgi:hypothetical protein